MSKILKILIVVFAITIFSFIGFGIRIYLLNKKITSLEMVYENKQAIADGINIEINLSDEQSEQDKKFLDIMFGEIFTFYDMNDFKNARRCADGYNLSEEFVDKFYDTSELTENAYAEAMLDILCKYDSSELYLVERRDGIGYYIVIVTLDTVKYNSSFEIVLFLTLSESGDENERVQSIVYYNAS